MLFHRGTLNWQDTTMNNYKAATERLLTPPFRRTIVSLHPSLKACSCGFIGDRNALYKHFDNELTRHKELANREPFFSFHGELPLNSDDPRVANLEQALEKSIKTRQQIIDNL